MNCLMKKSPDIWFGPDGREGGEEIVHWRLISMASLPRLTSPRPASLLSPLHLHAPSQSWGCFFSSLFLHSAPDRLGKESSPESGAGSYEDLMKQRKSQNLILHVHHVVHKPQWHLKKKKQEWMLDTSWMQSVLTALFTKWERRRGYHVEEAGLPGADAGWEKISRWLTELLGTRRLTSVCLPSSSAINWEMVSTSCSEKALVRFSSFCEWQLVTSTLVIVMSQAGIHVVITSHCKKVQK